MLGFKMRLTVVFTMVGAIKTNISKQVCAFETKRAFIEVTGSDDVNRTSCLEVFCFLHCPLSSRD